MLKILMFFVEILGGVPDPPPKKRNFNIFNISPVLSTLLQKCA